MMRALKSISIRLVASYIFDWIVIVGIVAVGAAWNNIEPYHRPFSVVDLSISYPFQEHEKVPLWLLVFVACVIPAGIIFLVAIIFVPGGVPKGTPKSLIWRRKLWEWNTGWMGLAMSLAIAFLITQGMKLLFGRPRPDLLSRCKPDLSLIPHSNVSTAGGDFSRFWVLVTSDICTQTDDHKLQDGFKSYPSGHSSFSWAGLLYLTLFLASKFSVSVPYLPPRPFSLNPAHTSAASPSNIRTSYLPTTHKQPRSPSSSSHPPETLRDGGDAPIVPIRNQAAAPPVYTLIFVLIPICGAIYITSTRFTDFRHHPFDLLFGSFIGITSAYFSFRWYHLPIRRGAGWSWGPRSYERSWGIGVGSGGYVGTEGWSKRSDEHAFATQANNGNGMQEHRAGVAAAAAGPGTESERRAGIVGDEHV